MAITIKELASQLSVSIATVSMALNNSPKVAEKTRKRVIEAAEKHGYIANNFGRSLRTNRSQVLGCLTGSITSSFFNALLEGVHMECTQNEYGLLTCFRGKNNDKEEISRHLKLMIQRNVDGIIFLYPLPQDLIDQLNKHNIPFVFCSIYDGDDYPKVLIDNEKAGFLAMNYMLENGHRHILCCDQDSRRYRGNQLAAQNYPTCQITSFSLNETNIVDYIEKNPAITGIVAYSDEQAIKLIRQLRTANLRVPQDVSIIGFDDMPYAAWPEFELTTIAQPQLEIGRESVKNILDQIKNIDNYSKKTILPVTIKQRKSVKNIN